MNIEKWFLEVFTRDERHVYLHFWTMEIWKQ